MLCGTIIDTAKWKKEGRGRSTSDVFSVWNFSQIFSVFLKFQLFSSNTFVMKMFFFVGLTVLFVSLISCNATQGYHPEDHPTSPDQIRSLADMFSQRLSILPNSDKEGNKKSAIDVEELSQKIESQITLRKYKLKHLLRCSDTPQKKIKIKTEQGKNAPNHAELIDQLSSQLQNGLSLSQIAESVGEGPSSATNSNSKSPGDESAELYASMLIDNGQPILLHDRMGMFFSKINSATLEDVLSGVRSLRSELSRMRETDKEKSGKIARIFESGTLGTMLNFLRLSTEKGYVLLHFFSLE